jgi:hypothetical protein
MSKATPKDVARALAVMGASIDYFPSDPLGLEVVQDSIERHISTREELQSLVRIACDTMRRWSIPDFLALRSSVSERLFYERETQEQERKLRQWKEEAKLLGPGDPEPFEVPLDAVKPVAGPSKPVKQGPSLQELEEQLQQQLSQGKRTAEEAARLLADLETQVGKKDWLN